MPIFDTKKYLQRFLDLADESPSKKQPIQTFQKANVISLEDAMQPIRPFLPHVNSLIQEARGAARTKTSNILTEDEMAAIFLYTAQWDTQEGSVYYQLNRALRATDKNMIKPWCPYLSLLLGALAELPSKSGAVFRGMKMNATNMYQDGQVFTWWSFTSCTDSLKVLQNESFFGQKGKRAFFTINCHNGKDIREYSFFKSESEILLPPMQEYRVLGTVPQGDMTMVQLEETDTKSLLELVAEESRRSESRSLQATRPLASQPGKIQCF